MTGWAIYGGNEITEVAKFPITFQCNFNWAPPRRGARARSELFEFNVARVHPRLVQPHSSPLSSASGPLYAAACHCGPLGVHANLLYCVSCPPYRYIPAITSWLRVHPIRRNPGTESWNCRQFSKGMTGR